MSEMGNRVEALVGARKTIQKVVPIRLLLLEANRFNPDFRPVLGFLEPFAVSSDDVTELCSDSRDVEIFDILFDDKGIEIYKYRKLMRDGDIKLVNDKFIASQMLEDDYRWLVIQGLIPVNHTDQLKAAEKEAKKKLIQKILEEWNVDLMK